jgi:hypothetical protein
MHIINRLLNLILGGNRPTEKFVMPSKQRVVNHMYFQSGLDWHGRDKYGRR